MKKLIKTLRNMASELNVWANDAQTGGLRPSPAHCRASSRRLTTAADEAEGRLPKWQDMPEGDGHYWTRYRAWEMAEAGTSKVMAATFTTDLMYVETDPESGECFLASANLGPKELDMRDVGDDFAFSGPLKAPCPPVMEETES